MAGETAKFLIELLGTEEHGKEAVENQLASALDLTFEQRSDLQDLYRAYELLCSMLRQAIKRHE